MSNYSKLFGSFFGSAVGLAAGAGADMAWATPDIVDAFATLAGAAFGTWVAPPNREA